MIEYLPTKDAPNPSIHLIASKLIDLSINHYPLLYGMHTLTIHSQTSFPRSSTVAFIPPLAVLPLAFPACSIILAFSASRLCLPSAATRSASASALAAFSFSRFCKF